MEGWKVGCQYAGEYEKLVEDGRGGMGGGGGCGILGLVEDGMGGGLLPFGWGGEGGGGLLYSFSLALPRSRMPSRLLRKDIIEEIGRAHV